MSSVDDHASSEGFHPPLRHVPASAVDAETAQTSGMQRFAAISNAKVGSQRLWMGQTHVKPQMRSGDHHHGEAETAIFVVSGNPEFVFFDEQSRQEHRISAGPGDYIFVPPYTPHREENNHPEIEAVVVIARSTQEAIVVNLPSLHAHSED
ncbi:MAG: cupin domain-containing protein [Actinomycetota bacterium]|nr:cupin domain-containing protein [Actinomycetota bacterium]MDQ2958110.1 cupin domain-containing protein [Actinomycetota bacterium]